MALDSSYTRRLAVGDVGAKCRHLRAPAKGPSPANELTAWSIRPGRNAEMLQLRQLINSVVQRLREQDADEEVEAEPQAQDAATPRHGLPSFVRC